jgi:hypothetical protein
MSARTSEVTVQYDKIGTALRASIAMVRRASPAEEDVAALRSWVTPTERQLPLEHLARLIMNGELDRTLKKF